MASHFRKFFHSPSSLLSNTKDQDKILLSITEEQDKMIANTIKTVLKYAPRAASPEAADKHFDFVVRVAQGEGEGIAVKAKTRTLDAKSIADMAKANTEAQIAAAKVNTEAQIAVAKMKAEAVKIRATAQKTAIRAVPFLASGLAV
ncbi:hypothetical protein OQA88_8921 [Cercophora sp. LCS_1]